MMGEWSLSVPDCGSCAAVVSCGDPLMYSMLLDGDVNQNLNSGG